MSYFLDIGGVTELKDRILLSNVRGQLNFKNAGLSQKTYVSLCYRLTVTARTL